MNCSQRVDGGNAAAQELPPLKHISRQTMLDVHHAILPTTARLKPDSAKLLAASRPIEGELRLRILVPVDMVPHSATHLFCNEDVGNGLRELVDLDSLMHDFAEFLGRIHVGPSETKCLQAHAIMDWGRWII